MDNWKQDLVSGYKAFRETKYSHQKELYDRLGATTQNPRTMVISCSDSRVNPSDIFSSSPGDIFIFRNLANIVPPYSTQQNYCSTSAALEYAVMILNVKSIVVLGHEHCGGVSTFCEDTKQNSQHVFIRKWVHILDGKILKTPLTDNKSYRDAELSNVQNSIDNLGTFPFIQKAVKDGYLSLLGAYFSISQGQLYFEDYNAFVEA